MNRKALSIQNILLFVVGILTLIIILLAGYESLTDWRKLDKIEALKEASNLSDSLFDASEKLSLERDVAFSLLHAVDTGTIHNLQSRLKESRKSTDEAFTSIINSFAVYKFPELKELKQEIESRLINIRNFRPQIDSAVEQPEAAKKILAENWYNEATGLTEKTEELWMNFISHFTDTNPVVTQHLRFKHFLRLITDYTSRQRSIIGRLLVENSYPEATESAELLRSQGSIELSWKMSNMIGRQSGLMNEISSYYDDAKSHYQTMTDMMRDMFYVLDPKHGSSYPIDINLWFELSDQNADSLSALKEATFKETRRYVVALEKEARQSIILHVFLLLGTFALCAYSFWIITRRVIRPIHGMVEALIGATEGKPVARITLSGRDDEIGKLEQVLRAFQKNMEVIKQTASELEQSHERYRALVDATAQIVWTWKQGVIDKGTPLSNWWEKMTGQPSEMISTFGWLEVAHPDDRERVRKLWEDSLTNHTILEMDYRLRKRDGNYLHVEVKGVPLLNEDGSIREYIGSLNDVTARKEAENELRSYTQALERSNKELDDFAYIASHDLKEPLRGIHNYSCFLLEDNEGKLDEESIRKLNRLVYLSQRMERLVNDLLYFSRLGRQQLAIQKTDINEVIHDIESTLDVLLSERNAKILIIPPLPTITCDKTRITELFRNLITNAVKYNDKPEKTVEIGFLPTRVSPKGVSYKNVFYVKDNGKGIAPEFHQEVFRIFKRLQNNKDSKEEGTGVGLTFVKKIIERHGGEIWIESEIGKSTAFYFTLEEKKL
jgi:PAS domain S-box-containing protein